MLLYSSTRTRTLSIVFRTRRRLRNNNIRRVVCLLIFVYIFYIYVLSSHTRCSSVEVCPRVRETSDANTGRTRGVLRRAVDERTRWLMRARRTMCGEKKCT